MNMGKDVNLSQFFWCNKPRITKKVRRDPAGNLTHQQGEAPQNYCLRPRPPSTRSSGHRSCSPFLNPKIPFLKCNKMLVRNVVVRLAIIKWLMVALLEQYGGFVFVEGACNSVTSFRYSAQTYGSPLTYPPVGTTWTPSTTTDPVIESLNNLFQSSNTNQCPISLLQCEAVLKEDAVISGSSADMYASIKTTAHGIYQSGTDMKIKLTNTTLCPYSARSFYILCFNSDVNTVDPSTSIYSVEIQITVSSLSASSVGFTGAVTGLAPTAISATGTLNVFDYFSQYAVCTAVAYPIISSSGLAISPNMGNGTHGAIWFDKSTPYILEVKIKICQDTQENTCLESSPFNVTINCDPSSAGTVTNSDITSTTTTFNVVDSSTQPIFTLFGPFSVTNSLCVITDVNIYADTSGTAHPKLSISYNSGTSQYTVGVTNSADYLTATTYTFYIYVTIGGTEIGFGGASATPHQLITAVTCSSLIQHVLTWSDQAILVDTTLADLVLSDASGSWFATTDVANCPITSSSMNLLLGDASKFTGYTSLTGDFTIKRDSTYKNEFTITVCANSLTDASNCVTSGTRIVEVYSCLSNITFGTWNPSQSNPITSGGAGVSHPEILQSTGSNYVSTSNSGLCSIQSYEFATVSGDATKMNIISASGQIQVDTDVAYLNTFSVKVCAGNTDSLNCLTSSSQTVEVQIVCTTTDRLTLPTAAETSISSDYVLNGTSTMVNVSTFVNNINSYEVNTQLFFVTDCTLTAFEIAQVWDALAAKFLTSAEYSSLMTLDTASGLLNLIKFNVVQNYYVYLRAFNSQNWQPSSPTHAHVHLELIEPPVEELPFEVITIEEEPEEEVVINPMFESVPFCDLVEINFKNQSTQEGMYHCQLPPYKPSSIGKTAQLSILSGLDSSIMTFNQINRTLTIDKSKIKSKNIDQYPLKVQIMDNVELQTIEIVMLRIIEVSGIVVVKQNETEVVETAMEINTDKLNMTIKEVTNKGLMTLKFSSELNPINITKLNESVWDMYIVPAEFRDFYDDTFNVSHVNFTWNVTEHKQDLIMVQLFFNNPLSISPLKTQDRIVVHLVDPGLANLFVSKTLLVPLDKDSWTVSSFVRKQMQLGGAADLLESSAQDMKVLLNTMLVLSIMLFVLSNGGLAMRFMFIMVRSLQMIIHLPIINILFPGNVMLLISILVPFVGFDIMETYMDWEALNESFSGEIFDFNEHETIYDRVYTQIVDIDYESFNSIMILNTLGFILLFYLIQVFFWLLLKLVFLCSNNRRLQMISIKLQEKLFFGDLFQLYIQAFFEFSFAIILTLKKENHTKIGEKFSMVISLFSLAVAWIFLPLAATYIIVVPKERIQDQSFKKKWGVLYSNMDEKREDRAPRFYFLQFVIRRLIFIGCAFVLHDEPLAYQLTILEFLNMYSIIFQGLVNPHFTRIENRLESFNEFQVVACTILALCFTDWVADSELQYQMGWFMNGLIVLQVIVNLTMIIYYSLRLLKTMIKWIYNTRIRKCLGLNPNPQESKVENGNQGQNNGVDNESPPADGAVPSTKFPNSEEEERKRKEAERRRRDQELRDIIAIQILDEHKQKDIMIRHTRGQMQKQMGQSMLKKVKNHENQLQRQVAAPMYRRKGLRSRITNREIELSDSDHQTSMYDTLNSTSQSNNSNETSNRHVRRDRQVQKNKPLNFDHLLNVKDQVKQYREMQQNTAPAQSQPKARPQGRRKINGIYYINRNEGKKPLSVIFEENTEN